MKNIKRVIAAGISFLLIIGLAGCGLITRTAEGENKVVVAKVNSTNITKGDYQKRFNMQAAIYELYYGDDFLTNSNYSSQVSTLKTQTLDNMVQEELLNQKAKELKLVPDDTTLSTDAQKQLDSYMSSLQDQTKFKQKIADKGLTMDDFKNLFKRYVIANKVYDYVIKDVTVTDDELQQYYNKNIYNYTEKPDVMNVSHILVATKEEADSIETKLKNGAKFEDLAKQYSTDTGSKDQGGLLGDIDYTSTDYVTEFMEGALATPAGKISEPIKSQYGYHIIKINKKTEYPVKKFDTVKDEVKSTVLETKQSEKYQTTLTSWQNSSKITKYTDRL